MTDRFHEVLTTLSANLDRAPLLSLGAFIQEALAQIGEDLGADRAYVFTLSEAGDTLDNVLEWCRDGIDCMRSRNRAVSCERLPWLMGQLSQCSVVAIDDVQSLPAEARNEQEDFESQHIRSLIVLPLRHQEQLMGLIGFDWVRSHCKWPNGTKRALNRVAEMVAEALYRESTCMASARFASQARKFMAPLPGMVFQYEVDGLGKSTMPFVAEKLERFFGIEAATLQQHAKPLLDRIHDEDHARVMEAIDHSMAQTKPFHEEFRVAAGDRSMHWVRTTAIPERHSESVVWHGYLTEITDQIASEQTVIDQGLWTQTILENIDDAIFSIDQQGIIGSVNRSAERLFGYTAAEMKGERINIIMPEPHRSQHDAHLERYLFTGKTGVMGVSREFEALRADGSRFPIELQVTRITMNDSLYFIGVIRDITQRRRSEEKIHYLAYFDPLTGLPNRRLLGDRMEQALNTADQSGTAILFLGLDNFKALNDSFGHSMGDRYLRQVAHRLESKSSDNRMVARIGGDEFVVLLPGLDSDAARASLEAERIADEVRQELAGPFQLDGHEYIGSFGIGIALSHDQANTTEELLKQADMALHEAKKSGRNSVRVFSSAMKHEVERRLQLEREIRVGLEAKQFELHYQPQVQGGGRAGSVEALIRWRHPVEGWVSPGEFIPVCEQTGLILDLGGWVIEAACEQLAQWSRNHATAHLIVAINISMRQFHEPDFVARVLAALERTGAPPELLELELTESLFVQDMDEAIVKMKALRRHGVRFALDDFGTGYSSLSYLKRLPLNQLKIDKSFVQDIRNDGQDLEIARVIVALANTMGLEVIAEGVEVFPQCQALASIGCHRYQGFLFARPMPAESVIEALEQVQALDWQNMGTRMS